MKRSRGKELKQEMNLTNMIDIVFSILIVFIISAPLMSQGVKVDLPKAEAPTMEQEKLLKVSITKDEEIYIADMQVDFEGFNTVFKSRDGRGHQCRRGGELRACDEGRDEGAKTRRHEAWLPDTEPEGKTG